MYTCSMYYVRLYAHQGFIAKLYTKQYSLVIRLNPEGLMNIAECIHR